MSSITGCARILHVITALSTTAVIALSEFQNDVYAYSNNSSLGDPISSGIVTIPLIPYHIVRRRNLKAALEYEQQNRNAGYPTRRRRHHYRHLQNEQSDENESYNALQVAGLFQGWGTHYADLWCGTPPQRQTVIVDTGSGVTAFPCSECNDCGVPDYHIDKLFSEKESTTFRSLSCEECLRGSCSNGDSCTIGQAYQEGSSWTAYEALDSCYVGGLHKKPLGASEGIINADGIDPSNAMLYSFNMKFGCQTRLTGLFKTQLADGIMGMDVAEASFWWQMFEAGRIPHKAFSLCFSRKTEADPKGTEAGAMSLGGTDKRLHETPMVYSETRTGGGAGFYVVDIKAVYLRSPGGGNSAKTNVTGLKYLPVDISETDVGQGARVIVDSGTTDTYFSTSFGTPFKNAWRELVGEDYGTEPVDLTAEELDERMPTILFQLHGSAVLNKGVQDRSADGSGTVSGLATELDPDNPFDVILAIPPSHYFEFNDDIQKFESRFFVNDQSGGVLGANAMMGHDVYFDVDRQRIGWAESECDYSKIMSTYVTSREDNSNISDNNEEPINDNNTPSGKEGQNTNDNGDNPGDAGLSDKNDNGVDDSNNDEDIDSSNLDIDESPGGMSLPGNVCSDFTCHLVVSFCLLSVVAFGVFRVIRRPASGPYYDIANGTEAEFTEKSSYNDNDDTEFGTRTNSSGVGKNLTYRNGTAFPSIEMT